MGSIDLGNTQRQSQVYNRFDVNVKLEYYSVLMQQIWINTVKIKLAKYLAATMLNATHFIWKAMC